MIKLAAVLALLWIGAVGGWAWVDLPARTPEPAPMSTAELERACAARSYYSKPDCVAAVVAERRAAAQAETLDLALPGYLALGLGPAFGLLMLGVAGRAARRRRPPPPPAEEPAQAQ
jgi:hypothetical protein